MSVKLITERYQDRQLSDTLDSVTLTRAFNVYTDDKDDGAHVALQRVSPKYEVEEGLARLPEKRSLLNVTGLPLLWVVDRTVESPEEEVRTYYKVTIRYEEFPLGASSPNISPLDEPPDISTNFSETDEPFAFEINDDGTFDLTKPVTNSAQQPFDIPPERSLLDPEITIVRNIPLTSFAEVEAISGSVNSETWKGFPAGTLRIVMTTQRMRQLDFEYDRATFNIAKRTPPEHGGASGDGWDSFNVDEGYYRLDPDGEPGDVLQMKTSDGEAMNAPVLLDGNGQPLSGAAPTPVLLSFQRYKRLDFNTIVPLQDVQI